MVNIHQPRFDDESARYGFRYRRARLGYQAGCERLGVSLWELPPGQEGIYHYHLGNEELLWALSGGGQLRTPAGWRELEEGELVAFPRGPRGAHAVANRGQASLRFVFFSEMRGPEVVIYPDEETVGALEAMSSPERGGFAAWLKLDTAFERHDGDAPEDAESPPAAAPRVNVLAPRFEAERDRPGFRFRRARVGQDAGGGRLGASLYELFSGQAAWPYHRHLANEELMVVLAGEPSLRTPSGWRGLAEGEVTSFRVGEEGAHQVRNDSRSPVRILVVSEMRAPDVVVHLDSGKVGVREQAPGAVEGGGLQAWFPLGDNIDFWHGE
jgi:uncharacterized cupin superfamily protein